MTKQPRRTEVVSVRFTAAEVAEMGRLADGRPISHVVRELATRTIPAPFRMATKAVNTTVQPRGWFTCNAPAVQVGILPAILPEVRR